MDSEEAGVRQNSHADVADKAGIRTSPVKRALTPTPHARSAARGHILVTHSAPVGASPCGGTIKEEGWRRHDGTCRAWVILDYSPMRRPEQATRSHAGTSVAFRTFVSRRRVFQRGRGLRSSGRGLRDLVPAYVNNPGYCVMFVTPWLMIERNKSVGYGFATRGGGTTSVTPPPPSESA